MHTIIQQENSSKKVTIEIFPYGTETKWLKSISTKQKAINSCNCIEEGK